MSDTAVVTLDVLHSGVIWGWFVTMNLWAKSISTGALLVGAWAAARHEQPRYWRLGPWLGFIFLNITLLFTVGDLHQPLRFWHMFVYMNPTSAVAWAGWLLTAYNVMLFAMLALDWRGLRSGRLRAPVLVLAFLSTIYTAALLGQANAREVWSTPTEVAQTLLSAMLAGSATWLLLPGGGDDERRSLSGVFAGSAALSLVIFVGELFFAPMKSEEARWTADVLLHGDLASLMLPGLMLAFALPALVAALARTSALPLRLAALSALAGLWMVKHAFLLAPQLLPLS